MIPLKRDRLSAWEIACRWHNVPGDHMGQSWRGTWGNCLIWAVACSWTTHSTRTPRYVSCACGLTLSLPLSLSFYNESQTDDCYTIDWKTHLSVIKLISGLLHIVVNFQWIALLFIDRFSKHDFFQGRN